MREREREREKRDICSRHRRARAIKHVRFLRI